MVWFGLVWFGLGYAKLNSYLGIIPWNHKADNGPYLILYAVAHNITHMCQGYWISTHVPKAVKLNIYYMLP